MEKKMNLTQNWYILYMLSNITGKKAKHSLQRKKGKAILLKYNITAKPYPLHDIASLFSYILDLLSYQKPKLACKDS